MHVNRRAYVCMEGKAGQYDEWIKGIETVQKEKKSYNRVDYNNNINGGIFLYKNTTTIEKLNQKIVQKQKKKKNTKNNHLKAKTFIL